MLSTRYHREDYKIRTAEYPKKNLRSLPSLRGGKNEALFVFGRSAADHEQQKQKLRICLPNKVHVEVNDLLIELSPVRVNRVDGSSQGAKSCFRMDASCVTNRIRVRFGFQTIRSRTPLVSWIVGPICSPFFAGHWISISVGSFIVYLFFLF